MKPAINYQQALVWAVQMTAQMDYQSLTHVFLSLIKQLSFIEHAAVYEIYGERQHKSGQARSIGEHLIRRFPLDFTEEEQAYENPALLEEINNTEDLVVDKPNAKGRFTQLIASIHDVSGPDRAVLLFGVFADQSLNLVKDLIAIYHNQVALHDNKERDLLTRLPNRQTFEARIVQVCDHFRQRGTIDRLVDKSSWIAMLDIDHFKVVNDTHGHFHGDEVLLIFSQLMEKHFRYNDFLFRFGGEEFVVILNLVNQADAEATFERFRKAIAEYQFPSVGNVTVSIGAAHISPELTPAMLLNRADKALYYAKAHGRNRLTLFEKTLVC